MKLVVGKSGKKDCKIFIIEVVCKCFCKMGFVEMIFDMVVEDVVIVWFYFYCYFKDKSDLLLEVFVVEVWVINV